MSAPDEPTLALVDVISIDDWLARQDGRTAHTPPHLMRWLHQQIADVASDPDLARAARLTAIDEFRTLFAARLDAAITAGWDTHGLDGEDLFERYAGDERFRAELQATAGIAAYTAVRADASLPEEEYRAAAVIPTRRQQLLIKAIEDHAARYAPPHNPMGGLNPARYVAEAHVPGGASRVEWDWIAYYIAAHSDVLQQAPLSLTELDRRDRETAESLDRQAADAFRSGDYPRALDLIDQAELHQPGWDWQPTRDHINRHAARAGTDSDPSPAAGSAFAHLVRQPPAQQPRQTEPVPPHPEHVRRGTHR